MTETRTDLKVYKDMPEWTAQTLPKAFQTKHNTKEGSWARLTVLEGSLRFIIMTEAGETISEHVYNQDSGPQLLEPQVWHRVEIIDDSLRCQLSFLCEPGRYFEKKYAVNPPHADLRAVMPELLKAPGRSALDLGCGQGRNACFLVSQGFSVTALDRSEPGVQKLQQIAAVEQAPLKAALYDINSAALATQLPGGQVDHIVSTVVLQFLDPERLPAVIADMQAVTRPGGLHFIVVPLTSEEVPCPIPLPALPGRGELREYYKGWEFIRYEETLGEFHRRDENGQRYKAEFCTMLAKKPE